MSVVPDDVDLAACEVFRCEKCGCGYEDCVSPPAELLEWFDRRQSVFLQYHDYGQGLLSPAAMRSFEVHFPDGI